MTRTKQQPRPSGSAPAKMRPACSRMQNDEPPVDEETKDGQNGQNGKKCVSDSEEGSWQDSGDEDMKELFAAEEAEMRAEAQAQAHVDEDTLSDDEDDDDNNNEAGAKDPEKKPPAKRARTSDK